MSLCELRIVNGRLAADKIATLQALIRSQRTDNLRLAGELNNTKRALLRSQDRVRGYEVGTPMDALVQAQAAICKDQQITALRDMNRNQSVSLTKLSQELEQSEKARSVLAEANRLQAAELTVLREQNKALKINMISVAYGENLPKRPLVAGCSPGGIPDTRFRPVYRGGYGWCIKDSKSGNLHHSKHMDSHDTLKHIARIEAWIIARRDTGLADVAISRDGFFTSNTKFWSK